MAKVKEPVSGFSHALGGLASIAGLVLMVVFASIAENRNSFMIVSVSIFGTTLVLLYTFSALYHLLNLGEKGTSILRKFDHIMIYFLIAGTYTPILLGPMRGGWGWSLFGVVWGLALLGTLLTIFWINAPRWLTTGIYLGMGWLVLVAIYPLIITFGDLDAISTLWWLVAGGLSYTARSNYIWSQVA